jgi:hypothetical protein
MKAGASVIDVGPPTVLEMAKACRGNCRLRGREADFVNNVLLLAARGPTPSPKQARWLRAIFDKCNDADELAL